MLKKISIAVSLLLSSYASANNINTCSLEVAVSSPPIMFNENVAFNVTVPGIMNKSVTLFGGSLPFLIQNLPCSNDAYYVTATPYQLSNVTSIMGIGACQLKANPITLASDGDNASVVFPQDFDCNA